MTENIISLEAYKRGLCEDPRQIPEEVVTGFPPGKESWDELTDEEKEAYLETIENTDGYIEYFIKHISLPEETLRAAVQTLESIEAMCKQDAAKQGVVRSEWNSLSAAELLMLLRRHTRHLTQ